MELPIAATALAEWVRDKKWISLSPDQKQSVGDSIVDTVGVALSGSREPVSTLIREFALSFSATGGTDVWGVGQRMPSPSAALSNGTAAMSQEFDDRHRGYGHPSCVLVPALIAAGQEEGISGLDLLEGYAAALGVFVGVGHLFGAHREPRLEERGWHITSVLGTVAAAAGVAKTIGLDCEGIATAIGVSTSMAGGLSGNNASPTKALHAGRAAQAGVEAALLTRAGLTCRSDVIDGAHGAMVAFGHAAGPEVLTGPADIDHLYQIADSAASGLVRKRFPTFGATHLAIDAALDVRARAPDLRKLTAVHVRLPFPRGGSAVSFKGIPQTPSEARHSFAYVVATALAHGYLVPRHFTEGRLFDRRTREIWDLVDVGWAGVDDAALADGTPHEVFAEVTLDFSGGVALTARRDYPPENIAGEAVDEKFGNCAQEIFTEPSANRLLTRLRSLESLDRIDRIFEGLDSKPSSCAETR